MKLQSLLIYFSFIVTINGITINQSPSQWRRAKKIVTSKQAKIVYGIIGTISIGILGLYGLSYMQLKAKIAQGKELAPLFHSKNFYDNIRNQYFPTIPTAMRSKYKEGKWQINCSNCDIYDGWRVRRLYADLNLLNFYNKTIGEPEWKIIFYQGWSDYNSCNKIKFIVPEKYNETDQS